MSELGHSRRFRDVRDMSGLPPNNRHFRTRSALRIWATSGLMRCNKNGAVSENRLSGVQLIEQRLRLLQIARVEAFGEPAVDWREEIMGLLPLPLIPP